MEKNRRSNKKLSQKQFLRLAAIRESARAKRLLKDYQECLIYYQNLSAFSRHCINPYQCKADGEFLIFKLFNLAAQDPKWFNVINYIIAINKKEFKNNFIALSNANCKPLIVFIIELNLIEFIANFIVNNQDIYEILGQTIKNYETNNKKSLITNIFLNPAIEQSEKNSDTENIIFNLLEIFIGLGANINFNVEGISPALSYLEYSMKYGYAKIFRSMITSNDYNEKIIMQIFKQLLNPEYSDKCLEKLLHEYPQYHNKFFNQIKIMTKNSLVITAEKLEIIQSQKINLDQEIHPNNTTLLWEALLTCNQHMAINLIKNGADINKTIELNREKKIKPSRQSVPLLKRTPSIEPNSFSFRLTESNARNSKNNIPVFSAIKRRLSDPKPQMSSALEYIKTSSMTKLQRYLGIEVNTTEIVRMTLERNSEATYIDF